ncbi:eukaryotic translation initiation factor 4E [Collariella sp. IMI 366227]|nr:eukaryotic translation initiation factor 4E [Collariella sp. IMI 366227]
MFEQVDLTTIPVSPEGGNNANGAATDGAEDASKTVTVFHDKENFNVKHPLLNRWTLWFTKPASGKGDNWNDLLKEVITFESVEEFWGVYNNIAHVSELALKADYHLFKEGVRPDKWSKDKRSVNIDEIC